MARGREEVALADLNTQLRIISRLLAAQLRSTVSQQDLVKILIGTGASHAEIADVLGTTTATVAVTVQRLKKRAAKPSTRGGAPDNELPESTNA